MRDLMQSEPTSVLRMDVIVGLPVQLSVAVAVPVGNDVGLQPRLDGAGHDVNAGGVTSIVQVKVWIQVDEFPQLSVAIMV